MAVSLRAMVLLLSGVIVAGLSSSASSAEDAEAPHHAAKLRHPQDAEAPHHAAKGHSHKRHKGHHHSPDGGSTQLIAEDGSDGEDGVQLSIAAKGSLERGGAKDGHGIVRREVAEPGQEHEMERHRYATSPTPRPHRSASVLQDEPHVSCGKHQATECAACVLSHGPDWCHGDCMWDEDQTICKANTEKTVQTTTTDKYPGTDESAMSDDAIANKLRAEQEAAEEQERIDKGKFWATVGLAAGASGVGIMMCGMIAICFVLKSDKPVEPKKVDEEPLKEGDDAAKDDEEPTSQTAEDKDLDDLDEI